MPESIRVAVLGACGKMGREVVKTVVEAQDTELVGAVDVTCVGCSVTEALWSARN